MASTRTKRNQIGISRK
ncbi:hypothetical protein Anas_02211 [Armadillidium nasatum]|uniref:Uncharacterized protein n=1 Tax=Armadillidium nasatum TaxID=96803 RepID=A0A5N5TKI3_9CRUS|nr:hypothetical protein Anas_02211 [Armadillidium nasatum]